MSGSGRQAFPDIWEGLPTTQGHPGESLDYSRTSGRVSRPLLDIPEGLSTIPDIWEGLPTTQGHSGGSPRPFQKFGRAFRPLLDIRQGLPTTPGYP